MIDLRSEWIHIDTMVSKITDNFCEVIHGILITQMFLLKNK
jgi:hypothetical protein